MSRSVSSLDSHCLLAVFQVPLLHHRLNVQQFSNTSSPHFILMGRIHSISNIISWKEGKGDKGDRLQKVGQRLAITRPSIFNLLLLPPYHSHTYWWEGLKVLVEFAILGQLTYSVALFYILIIYKY